MSEENLVSLNSRKRSKANMSQSNILSGFASKDQSFTRNRQLPERESWMSKGIITEADQLDEAKSSGSGKEASTKIEDLPDSVMGDKRDSVPLDDSRIIKPEVRIPTIKLHVRHSKAASMADHLNITKGSPKVVLGNRDILSPNINNVQMGKAIKNLKMGTSNDWNRVFDKKTNKPSIVNAKNPSLSGSISTLKLNTSPSKKSIKDDKKKPSAKLPGAVKTAEGFGAAHRRTTSDINQFSTKINFQVNTARGLPKTKGKPECRTEEKNSPTKTIGSMNSDFGSPRKHMQSTIDYKKKTEPIFRSTGGIVKKEQKQVKVIIEKDLNGLISENILLKKENLQFKQVGLLFTIDA